MTFRTFPYLPSPPQWRIGLASGSPRRRELLSRLYGPDSFTVFNADIDETQYPGEMPDVYCTRLALTKADTIAARVTAQSFGPNVAERALIIGADTTVALNDVIFGKPNDAREARNILRQLSGRTHEVVTGLAVVEVHFDATGKAQPGRRESGYVSSDVLFRLLNDEEIDWYIQTGEPMDKAGAYGIQGYGSLLINSIEGDYYNIVGLPLVELIRLLRMYR